MNSPDNDPDVSVREIGGEVWAEALARLDQEGSAWVMSNQVVDLVMGVLARHVGKTLRNDEDRPVAPLHAVPESE